MENKTFITADAERNIPVTEPERQYYFIEKAKEKLTKLKEEEKREFTFCVTTFGCQMNARDSEKLVGILEQIGYVEEPDEEKADFVIFRENRGNYSCYRCCNSYCKQAGNKSLRALC